MNDPTSRHTDGASRPTVVIVVDDPTQLPADLATLVGHLQSYAWPNGRPSIQVVAASPRPNPGSPFVERRKRTTDRRQNMRLLENTELLVRPESTAASNDPSPSQPLPGKPATNARHPCTDREREIVQLLRRGLTNKQIAQELGVMEDTVKKHLQHIYDKFGVRRRTLVMLSQVGASTYIDRNPAFP